MALSVLARRTLKHMLKDNTAGGEIADVIDADGGTLTDRTKDYLAQACANQAEADAIATSIDAGTALTGRGQQVLGIVLQSRPIAAEIAAVLSA